MLLKTAAISEATHQIDEKTCEITFLTSISGIHSRISIDITE